MRRRAASAFAGLAASFKKPEPAPSASGDLPFVSGNTVEAMVADAPKKAATADYLYPAGAAYVYGNESYPHEPEEIGGLTFKTEPFSDEQILLGPTIVRLHVASTAPDTTFLLVLNEVDKAGQSQQCIGKPKRRHRRKNNAAGNDRQHRSRRNSHN